jgi:hypothetical protein
MVMTYIPSDATWHKKQEYIWFRGWDLSAFWDIMTLPVKGGWDHHVRSWIGLGVRISVLFEIYGHFLFTGEWDHHVQSWRTYHQKLLDTRNIYIFGLGVAISMVFKIFDHFLYQGGQGHSIWSWPIYHQMLLDKRNKNIWFRGGDLNSFRDIWALPVSSGDRTILYCHDLQYSQRGSRIFPRPRDDVLILLAKQHRGFMIAVIVGPRD